MQKKTVHFSVDGRDLSTAFTDIKTGVYYLGISMYAKGSVTIVDFKCNAQSQGQLEQKETELESLKKQISDIKKENNALNTTNIQLKQESRTLTPTTLR